MAAARRLRIRAAREITLMWMHTGTPASAAAAQKASSASPSSSSALGQLDSTTVLKPRSTARCRAAMQSAVPVEGSCAAPTRRVRSGAVNSCHRNSL